MKGSVHPMNLYTIDVDTSSLNKQQAAPRMDRKSVKARNKLHYQEKCRIKKAALNGNYNTAKLFVNDEDLKKITANCQPGASFRQSWQKCFQTYIKGNWGDAKSMFEEFMRERPDIKTTEVVYNYMANRNFQAPSDWAGFRALTSK